MHTVVDKVVCGCCGQSSAVERHKCVDGPKTFRVTRHKCSDAQVDLSITLGKDKDSASLEMHVQCLKCRRWSDSKACKAKGASYPTLAVMVRCECNVARPCSALLLVSFEMNKLLKGVAIPGAAVAALVASLAAPGAAPVIASRVAEAFSFSDFRAAIAVDSGAVVALGAGSLFGGHKTAMKHASKLFLQNCRVGHDARSPDDVDDDSDESVDSAAAMDNIGDLLVSHDFAMEHLAEKLEDSIAPGLPPEQAGFVQGDTLVVIDALVHQLSEQFAMVLAQSMPDHANFRVSDLLHTRSDFVEEMANYNKHIFSLFSSFIQNSAPEYDKAYGPGHNFWTGALKDGANRGKLDYFCPVGWSRLGIRVDLLKCFDGWCVLYHGTSVAAAEYILCSTVKASLYGRYRVADNRDDGVPCAYFTPCISYAAHPTYSSPLRLPDGRWAQVCFQVRVDPSRVQEHAPATLLADQNTVIDSRYSNSSMEWRVPAPTDPLCNPDPAFVCYGLMYRVTDVHPSTLPESSWWSNCHGDFSSGSYGSARAQKATASEPLSDVSLRLRQILGIHS